MFSSAGGLTVKTIKVLGIDPGNEGAFVLYDGSTAQTWMMPVTKESGATLVDFNGVHGLLWDLQGMVDHVFLERAVSFAMGVKGAFNYGRGFASLEIAIQILHMPVTYVEPGKWTKTMHEGISSDLKPKAKSLIAVKRLFPKLVSELPQNRNGKLLEGPIDALLIAAYGLKRL